MRRGNPITMAGGRQFWPMAPLPEDVRIEDIALALSHLCRWGGRTTRFYSVAQHSVWVARRVAETDPHLVLQALLHDAAEAYVGDQVRPLKSALWVRDPEGRWLSFQELENRTHAAILKAFGVRPANSGEWSVIAAADEVALATEARDLLGQRIGHATPAPVRLNSWLPRRAQEEFLSVFRAAARPTKPPPVPPPSNHQHTYRGPRGTTKDDRSTD